MQTESSLCPLAYIFSCTKILGVVVVKSCVIFLPAKTRGCQESGFRAFNL